MNVQQMSPPSWIKATRNVSTFIRRKEIITDVLANEQLRVCEPGSQAHGIYSIFISKLYLSKANEGTRFSYTKLAFEALSQTSSSFKETWPSYDKQMGAILEHHVTNYHDLGSLEDNPQLINYLHQSGVQTTTVPSVEKIAALAAEHILSSVPKYKKLRPERARKAVTTADSQLDSLATRIIIYANGDLRSVRAYSSAVPDELAHRLKKYVAEPKIFFQKKVTRLSSEIQKSRVKAPGYIYFSLVRYQDLLLKLLGVDAFEKTLKSGGVLSPRTALIEAIESGYANQDSFEYPRENGICTLLKEYSHLDQEAKDRLELAEFPSERCE